MEATVFRCCSFVLNIFAHWEVVAYLALSSRSMAAIVRRSSCVFFYFSYSTVAVCLVHAICMAAGGRSYRSEHKALEGHPASLFFFCMVQLARSSYWASCLDRVC